VGLVGLVEGSSHGGYLGERLWRMKMTWGVEHMDSASAMVV